MPDMPVGFVCVRVLPEAIFVGAIELARNYQSRGIGSSLFEQLIQVSENDGKPLRLQVFKV